MDEFPFWIGHRGLRQVQAENTMASFQCAYDHGLRAIETDVKLTQDGQLWLFHDDDLSPLSNGHGPAKLQNWDYLKNLTITETEPPCLLAQLLAWLPNDMMVNLEIKPCPGREDATAAALADFLRDYHHLFPRILISSFSVESMITIKTQAPMLQRAMLWEKIPDDWRDVVKKLAVGAVHCDDDWVDADIIGDIMPIIPVRVYTVNDYERALYLKKLGVAGVFTDLPLNRQKN